MSRSKVNYIRVLCDSLVRSLPFFSRLLPQSLRVYSPGNYLIKVNPQQIVFGDGFFNPNDPHNSNNLTDEQWQQNTKDVLIQQGLIIKGTFHLALRHPVRAKFIGCIKDLSECWTIATDCVTWKLVTTLLDNHVEYRGDRKHRQDLKKRFDIWLEENAFTFERLRSEIGDFLPRNIENSWTVEDLFNFLINLEAPTINITDTTLDSTEPDPDTSQDQYIIGGVQISVPDESHRKDVHKKRLQTAAQQYKKYNQDVDGNAIGSDPLGFAFGKLLNELEENKIPWTTLLRQWLKKRYLGAFKTDYHRSSRNYLAGAIDHWEPGRRKKEEYSSSLLILIDLSGSCFDEDTQAAFAAEIDAIQKASNIELTIATFDTQVYTDAVKVLKPKELFSEELKRQNITLMGGGGTSFVQPLAFADEQNCNATIVFTDMLGGFPENPPQQDTLFISNTDLEDPYNIQHVQTIHLNT